MMKRLRVTPGMLVGIDQSATGTAATALLNGKVHKRIWWADSKKAAKERAEEGARAPVPVKGADELARVLRLDDIRSGMMEFIADVRPEYAALEGYANTNAPLAARLLGEVGGIIRIILHAARVPFRVYDIDDIKKYATGNYKAEKAEIIIISRDRWDEDFMPYGRVDGAAGNLADSHAIVRMLEEELRLRNGEVSIADVPPETREVFNKATKARPQNYLATPFIKSEIV